MKTACISTGAGVLRCASILLLLLLVQATPAHAALPPVPLKILSDSRHAYSCITATIDLLLGTGHVGADIVVHSTNTGASGPFSTNVADALNAGAAYYDESGALVPASAPYHIFTSSCTNYTGDTISEYNLSDANDLAHNYGYSAALPAGTPPPAFHVSPGYGGGISGPGVEWILDTSAISTGFGTLSCAEGANAGMMTVLRHNHPTWNWFDVKAALRQTGSNWLTGYDANAYGFGKVNYAAANSYADSELLLQPPGVKAGYDNQNRVQFQLFPFKQTRRVKDVLYQFPAPLPFQAGELTQDAIAALGGRKIAEYGGSTALSLVPLAETAVGAYFVWFTADNANDLSAKFSRIDTYGTFGPLSQTVEPVTVAVPDQGTYYGPQAVTLTCSEGSGGCGPTYFTTDGSTPTTNSVHYASPIAIPTSTTLRFFSLGKNGNPEAVRTKTYTLVAAPPTSVPALGPWGVATVFVIAAGTGVLNRTIRQRGRHGAPWDGPV